MSKNIFKKLAVHIEKYGIIKVGKICGPFGYRILSAIEKAWRRSVILRGQALEVPCQPSLLSLEERAYIDSIGGNDASYAWSSMECSTSDMKMLFLPSETFHLLNVCYSTKEEDFRRLRMRWWKKLFYVHENVFMVSDKLLYKYDPKKHLKVFQTNKETDKLGQESCSEFVLETFTSNAIASMCLEKALEIFLIDAFDGLQTLFLNQEIAPYQVAFWHPENHNLQSLSDFLCKSISKCGLAVFKSFQSAQKSIDYFDAIGIPFVILLDNETLETGICKLRNIETQISESLHYSHISEVLCDYFRLSFTPFAEMYM